MTNPPKNIRAQQESGEFEIVWSDDSTFRLPYKFVRGECPCAGCVNEFTGEKMIDVDAIPADIHPQDLSFVGNYAIRITWSDKHNTGLYTWDQLDRLCRQTKGTAARS